MMRIRKNYLSLTAYVLLLFVCVVGLLMSGNTYAKYTSEYSSAPSGSVSVATPILSVTGVSGNVFFDEGKEGFYRFTVSNSSGGAYSETNMTYVIEVTVAANAIIEPYALYESDNEDYMESREMDDVTRTITENENGTRVYRYSAPSMTFGNAPHSAHYILGFTATASGASQPSVRVVATQID